MPIAQTAKTQQNGTVRVSVSLLRDTYDAIHQHRRRTGFSLNDFIRIAAQEKLLRLAREEQAKALRAAEKQLTILRGVEDEGDDGEQPPDSQSDN